MPGRHPLDPLDQVEVQQAAASCRAKAAALGLPPLRFNVITLEEPSKAAWLAYDQGRGPPPPRLAFCILQTPPAFVVIEALVDIRAHAGAGAVVAWKSIDGKDMDGQPMATPDDCLEAEAIARQDPRVQQLVKARGIADFGMVACDPWAIHACPEEWQGRRLMQVFMYLKTSPDDNEYAHPMDLCPVVDLNTREVLHIDAYEKPPPIPMTNCNYHQKLLDRPFREPPKPLAVIQPQGPSFSVDGWRVTWQQWDIRLGFNAREGLVLYNVGYHDPMQGRLRPILHRASVVEMSVPYGDPRPPYNRKSAFDAGDYGLGLAANSLELGCDCLGHVHYFDGVCNDSKGQPYVIKNAVCLHEEDYGLLWKHVDYRTGYAEVRRGRRLVLSFIMTAVNYEYAFYWYLYQDGTIGHEIKLTGILSTSLLSPGEAKSTHGTMVGAGVNAAQHQHLFSARLDMAVDDPDGGRSLVVSEVDAVQVPTGPANPAGNAFVSSETDLQSMHSAMRMAKPEVNRVWRVKNPARRHGASGEPVAYHLYPAAGPVLLAQPDSVVARRGMFTTKSLFVTPHVDGQLYPCGLYVMQSRRDAGLAVWTKQDKPLAGADPVLWYTYGVTHFVRPEDYPVMPCDQVGFHLKPFGFFDVNPSIDVPPERDTHSVRHGQHGAAAGAGGSCCQPASKL